MELEQDWKAAGTADQQHQPSHDGANSDYHPKGKPVAHLRVVTANADGVIVLPAGTDINRIDMSGRDLIITLPDGERVVIVDGAILMPRIVVGDIEIPSVNLAALLIGEEPQPAAGPPRSSGGNFAESDGNIGDPIGLGDLLPPTELQFTQAEQQEILPVFPVDDTPEILIVTPDQPAGAISATASVDEAGLGPRDGEPAGSAAASDREATSGTIVLESNDGPLTVTINGIAVTGAGQTITTPLGVMTITSFSDNEIGYRYVLTDNVLGTPPSEVFTVVVTDSDGDQATATLTISIADDVPTAADDVDSVTEDGPLTADGNVLTGAGGTDQNATDGVADVQGADGATVTTVGTFQGSHGTLILNADGSYSYTLNNGDAAVQLLVPGETLTDSFSYTITDGDGDTSSATLTITVQGADDGVTITGLSGNGEGDGAEVTLFENDLADGSSPDEAALTQGGSFTIAAADGLKTVTIGGVTIYSETGFVAGQVVMTPVGVLTITGFTPSAQSGGSVTAGTFTYSFALTDNSLAHQNTGADSILQSFAVVATDRNGTVASGSLDVAIIDDLPVARNDVDGVAAGSYGPEEGNVITGGGTLTGAAGADARGADGAVVAGVAAGADGAAQVASGTVGIAVAGLYGTLTLNADGSYDYVRNAGTPGGVSDHFTYTLRDGDGDLSAATLRIDIADSGVVIISVPRTGDGTVVDEEGLDERPGGSPGSNAAADSDSTSGTITFSAADGPATITINGIVITGAGQTITTDKGVLTITAVTADSISYSYALSDNVSGDTVTDSFALTVTDQDGDSASDNLVISIIDDVPTAVADAAEQGAENAPILIDVFANDIAGADGVNLESAVALVDGPAKGTAVYEGNGVFLYTPAPGAEGTDSFTYSITDGDGDSSTATVTVTLLPDSAPTVSVTALTVSEAGLPDGTDADSDSETAGGAMTITTGNDSIAKVEVQDKDGAWVDVTSATVGTPVVVTGASGLLTVTSDGAGHYSYSYTLTANDPAHSDNDPGDGDGVSGADDAKAGDSFAVRVTDSDGSVSPTDSIDVTVQDDAPVAAADSGAVAEGGLLEVTAAAGVLANDHAGADGYSPGVVGVAAGSDAGTPVSGSVGVAVAGAYGTLTLHEDGSYSYKANPDFITSDEQDVFVYTIRDADGDLSTATLTITVGDITLIADDQTGTVYEAALDLTKDGDDLAPGTVEGSDPSAPGESVSGQLAVLGATGYTLVGSATGLHGQLLLNTDGSYTYTLTSPFTTDPATDDGVQTHPGVESFTYEAVDALGNSVQGTITIDIVDDVPVANDEEGITVVEGAGPIGGNVMANDLPGADGATLTAVVIDGGETVIAAEGTTVIDTPYGIYTFTSEGGWTFAPASNLDNPDDVDASFTYVLTDGDGDTATALQPIFISDGADPQAGDPISLVLDDQNLPGGTSEGEPDFASDSIAFTPGSDAIVSIVFGEPDNLGGGLMWNRVDDFEITGSDDRGLVVTLSLTVVDNVATVTATLNTNYAGHTEINVDDLAALGSVDVIAYDTDNDMAVGTVTVSVSDDLPVVSGSNALVQMDDDVLNGNPDGDGDGPDSVNVTGTLAHDYRADEPGSITLLDTGAPQGFTYELQDGVLAVSQGTTIVFTVTITDPVAGTYEIEQFQPILHADGAGENDQQFTISYRVTDSDNDYADGTLNISINDDTPVAADDTDVVSMSEPVAIGNVVTGEGSDGNPGGADSIGADGPSADGFVVAISGGTVGAPVAGQYGTLIISDTGDYSYLLDNNLPAVQQLLAGQTLTESFTYTLKDADGDTVTATLNITIQGTNEAPEVVGGAAVVSEEGLANGVADDVGSPTDTTNQSVATGSIGATDANGDDLTVTLGDPGAVLTVGGVQVSWTGVGTQTLIGSVGGAEVIRISITNAGDYEVTLSRAVDHAGIDVEDLKSFDVPVSVSDSAITVNSAISVTIEDDSPVAADEPVPVSEGGPVAEGNVLTNDALGADQPGAVVSINNQPIAAGGSQTIISSHGTLQLFSNGSYLYTPNASVAAGQQDSFTYVMRDADQDTSTATLTFTFGADVNKPTAGTEAATVDDDGLAGGNPLSTLGDIDANEGDADGSASSEASFSGTLPFTYGDDGGGSVTFANLHDTTGTVGTETVTYSWNAGTSTLMATINEGPRSGTELFKVVLDTATGAYTVTLLDNVLHAAGGNEANAAPVDLAFLVTDSDYDPTTNPGSSATGTLTISFNDDMPSATAPLSLALTNQAGATNSAFLDADQDVDNNYGADGGAVVFTAASVTALQSQALTSGFQALSYAISSDGLTLTATKPDMSVVFTVQLQPTGFADKYVVTMAQPLDAVTNVDFDEGDYDPVGGNGAWFGFAIPGENDSPDILVTPMINGMDGGTINSSDNTLGVSGGQSVGANEAVRVDFVTDLTGSPASGQDYSVPANQNHVFEGHYQANGASATFTNIGNNKSTSVRLVARDDNDNDNDVGDGTLDTINAVVISYNGQTARVTTDGAVTVGGHEFTVAFNGGQPIVSGVVDNSSIAGFTATGYTSIEFHHAGGDTFKIGNFGAAIQTTEPVNFTIPVTIADGDGDTASGGTLSITANAPQIPPIALDLDGDGLEFLPLAAGVTYDYGSGLVSTAWVAPDDGLLARATGSGFDIVFVDDAPDAGSDLQGLRLAYDSNKDGVFDAKDTAFAEFGVWQDANRNGVVDEGEFASLTDAGIVSIELVSDGESYQVAGGDVTVLGEASFTRTDKSTGTVGDAMFSIAPVDASKTQENTNSGFNQALVAASLVAVASAAEVIEDEPAFPAPEEEAATIDTASASTAAGDTGSMVTDDESDTSPASVEVQDGEEAEQPLETTSHGGEEVPPDHATLADADDISAPAMSDSGETDQAGPGNHQTLLAQSIDLPAFDGNAAVLAAAHEPAAGTIAADVVREALGIADGPDIDALLAALPGGDHPILPALLSPVAGEVADGGHMAAAAAIFEAAMAAHDAVAVAHA